MDTQKIVHSRVRYTYWDILGDFGGFREGLDLVIIFILGAFPEHAFLFKAIQKLFYAKTKDKYFFDTETL